MSNNSLYTKLKILGFDENEAKIYLATLKLDEALVNRIAKESGINRATCYGVLKKLQDKGAVSEKTHNATKYYSATDIDHLHEKLKHEFDLFSKSLPMIKGLKKEKNGQPNVQFFKGTEGVKMIYEDTLNTEGPIFAYVNSEMLIEKLYDYIIFEYLPKRIDRNINIKAIYPRNDAAYYAKMRSPKYLREIRFLPKKRLHISYEINIYNNKIAYIFYKGDNLYGTTIEDNELIKTEKDIFNMIWEYAGQLNQEIPDEFDYEKFIKEIIIPREARLK